MEEADMAMQTKPPHPGYTIRAPNVYPRGLGSAAFRLRLHVRSRVFFFQKRSLDTYFAFYVSKWFRFFDTQTHRHRHRHRPKRGYCDVFPGLALLKAKVWSAPRWLLRRGSCGLNCSRLEFEIAAEMVTPEIRCSSLVFALRSTANPRISVAIATSEAPKGASRVGLKLRLKWSPQKSVALASV